MSSKQFRHRGNKRNSRAIAPRTRPQDDSVLDENEDDENDVEPDDENEDDENDVEPDDENEDDENEDDENDFEPDDENEDDENEDDENEDDEPDDDEPDDDETDTATPRRRSRSDRHTRPRSTKSTSKSDRDTPRRRRRDKRGDEADEVASDESDDGTEATSPEPRLETRRLSSLKSFPLQLELFDDGNDYDNQLLADHIKEKGLRDPIEIILENRAGFPAGTVIDGHRRLRACKSIGLKEVRVRVRDDLAEADRNAIEQAFLREKLVRRHLDPLAKARVALRLYESEIGRERSKLRPDEESDARDRVGKTIAMSGRNLQRYWSVLQIPRSVQDAYRAGHLKLVDAAKVASLKRRQQEAIARRIDEGENPKIVLKEFIVKPERRKPETHVAVAVLARALRRAINDLKGREVDPDAVIAVERELKKGRRFIRLLLALRDED